jgi:hypothetical protein
MERLLDRVTRKLNGEAKNKGGIFLESQPLAPSATRSSATSLIVEKSSISIGRVWATRFLIAVTDSSRDVTRVSDA